MWDSIINTFGSLTTWVLSAINIIWATFRVYLAKILTIADFTKNVLKVMLTQLKERVDGWVDLIKNKVRRFFVVITKHINSLQPDPFAPVIKKAIEEEKYSIEHMDMSEFMVLPDTISVVETDENLNTENVHSVKASMFGDDFRKKFNQEVTELEFTL